MRHLHWLVLILASLPCAAQASTVTYNALIDTSSLAGTTGSLDLNFEAGPFGSQAATVQILNFGGGSPSGGPSLTGDASGSLPGTISLDNGTGYNDYFQDFTFGSSLSFEIALNGPAVGSATANSSGSTFAFSIFSDPDGTIPALTDDTTDGYAITVDINPDGSTTLRNYTNQSTAVTSEPPTATLVLTAAVFTSIFLSWKDRLRVSP